LVRRLPRRTNLLLVHLDISEDAPFIADALDFVRTLSTCGVVALNCLSRDIRKRTVQARCKAYGIPHLAATRDGRADELLIVKTDLNSGGTREQLLPAQQKQKFNLPASIGRLNGPSGYFVKQRGELGADIWNDPDLVVERYVTNARGRFFRIYVAANAIVISEAFDHRDVKRMGGDLRRRNYWFWRHDKLLNAYSDNTVELPAALLSTVGTFVDNFQLDFGALDVVESETGDYYVVDVNKTPFWGDERQPGLLEHLRLGLA
jgi:hypothetical protein